MIHRLGPVYFRKYLIFFCISSLLLLLLLLVPGIVNASGDDWLEGYGCSGSLGLIPFSSTDGTINLAGDKKLIDIYDNKTTREGLAEFCISKEYVGSVVDLKYNNGNTFSKDKSELGICANEPNTGNNYLLGVTKSGSSVTYFNDYSCCPASSPKLFDFQRNTGGARTRFCCKTYGTYTYVDGEYFCPDGEPVVDPVESILVKLGSNISNPIEGGVRPVFPNAEKLYSCPSKYCMLENNTEVDGSVIRSGLTEDQKSKYSCHASIGITDKIPADSIIDGNKVCYEGSLIDKTEYEEWGSLLGLYGSCYDSLDLVDRQRCIDCYTPCKGYDSCPLIYNSLGCVDTNPQGLITRVFQIGIGIIGAVGMVRVMQAAFMRQSGDPAKIKESYDIISSVVIGAILLIFGVVILRFVGVNVLQILPFDFLQ